MTEYENSKSDDQLEELLMLTEQMQEELDQKDRTIEKLKMQIDESLTLNEKLNSENKAGNIQALKNDLRKTKELLQSEKEKTHAAEIMTEECQDKLRQAEQERDYALSHQKKVEIPVEKPVFYQKCGNCNQTAYLKAKERYDTQREKLAGRYKAKTVMYMIDANGNIIETVSGTNDPDGKIAKENAERKAKENREKEEKIKEKRAAKKAEEEKAAKKRAEKSAEGKETGDYTLSVTGNDVKSMTQSLVAESVSISAPDRSSFDIKA